MTARKWRFAAIVGLVCCFTGSAYANGGVYLEDIRIKNNGKVVFSDDFNDGDISDWTHLRDVSVFTIEKTSTQMMLLNEHGNQMAEADHPLDLNLSGSLEFSTMVCIAPPTEQYYGQKDIACAFNMSLDYREQPNCAPETLRIHALLYRNDQKCKITVTRLSRDEEKYKSSDMSSAVLPTGKWAILTLRLDSISETATAYVDDSPVASIKYNANDFPKITSLAFYTTFGDGAQRTD
ncbi:MAG: hypothetical protein ABFD49_00875 [Armatimonadota bacterium]|nr:hypothetical protein [bacterium]